MSSLGISSRKYHAAIHYAPAVYSRLAWQDWILTLWTGGTGRTWIVKPISLNRGNGIEVFNSLADIVTHLCSKTKGERKFWGHSGVHDLWVVSVDIWDWFHNHHASVRDKADCSKVHWQSSIGQWAEVWLARYNWWDMLLPLSVHLMMLLVGFQHMYYFAQIGHFICTRKPM